MLTLTPKQTVAWQNHLDRPELRRHLFYGGARSGKNDVINAGMGMGPARQGVDVGNSGNR